MIIVGTRATRSRGVGIIVIIVIVHGYMGVCFLVVHVCGEGCLIRVDVLAACGGMLVAREAAVPFVVFDGVN
jgi:hypothetical protein